MLLTFGVDAEAVDLYLFTLLPQLSADQARGWRAEAIEHGQLAVIQIRQAKHPATVIRPDSQFAHGDGLPCRRIGTTAQTVWAMQAWALVQSGGILSAIA